MSYHWLLFDLDNTLFDFDTAEVKALAQTLAQFGLVYTPEIGDLYHRINSKIWQAFERGELTAVQLRVSRFQQLFAELGAPIDPATFSRQYLQNLGDCSDLMDGAEAVVNTLRQNCQLALITNGLSEVQRPRLANSTIGQWFTAVVISDELGIAKPDPRIFDAVFAQMGQPAKSEVLMIGDSLSSDIQGGVNYGLDTCWYNPQGRPNPNGVTPTYEIRHLSQLLGLNGLDAWHEN